MCSKTKTMKDIEHPSRYDKETNNMHGTFVDTERYPLTLNQLVSTIRRSVIWMLPGKELIRNAVIGL